MGYNLHITRADDWGESESVPITLAEWIDYIESDPEMRLDNVATIKTTDGVEIRYENEGLAVWTAHLVADLDYGTVWFDYMNGSIAVKHPDEATVAKMVSIARAFDAKVQGDDGEYYDEDGPILPEPTPSPTRPWWKRLFGG